MIIMHGYVFDLYCFDVVSNNAYVPYLIDC